MNKYAKPATLALGVVGLLGYEYWALRDSAKEDTISEIIWKLSQRPLVPFVLGMLAGHFVWQSQVIYAGNYMKLDGKGLV